MGDEPESATDMIALSLSAAHDMPLGRGILGAGGSSTVFESTYRGVAIALKVLKLTPAAHRCYHREVAAYLRLRPLWGVHTPELIAHGIWSNHVGTRFRFIATTLVDSGVPLDDVAAGIGHISPDALAAAALQATRGLAAIHGLGVGHGDVHGGNCLVTADGRAVWVDFSHASLQASEVEMVEEVWELEDVLYEVAERLGLEEMRTLYAPPPTADDVGSGHGVEGRPCVGGRESSASEPGQGHWRDYLIQDKVGSEDGEQFGGGGGGRQDVRAGAGLGLERPSRAPVQQQRAHAHTTTPLLIRTVRPHAPCAARRGVWRPTARCLV